MALTITPEILGQEVTSTISYCYLYEPLRVQIAESDSSAKKITIILELLDTTDTTNVIQTIVDYAVFDLNPGQPLSIDLMKIAQQHHDSNVYNFSSLNDIIYGDGGWQSIVSKYVYIFRIQSDVTTTPTEVKKLPIIGGRSFSNFTPRVTHLNYITELDQLVNGFSTFYPNWNAYTTLKTSLKDLSTGTDFTPIIQKVDGGSQLVFDQDLSNATNWTPNGAITSGQTSPTGEANAYKLSNGSGAASVVSGSILNSDVDGERITFSIWVKGEGTFGLFVQKEGGVGFRNYLAEVDIQAPSSWKRLTYTFTKNDDDGDVKIQIFKNPDGEDLFIYEPSIKHTVDKKADGGQVVWKSRLGGWLSWGFRLKKESQAKKYEGNIQVGMFESTLASNGNPYTPVDYTGISTNYSLTLKELRLTSDELEVVQNIIASPAVYYMKDQSEGLELMRLSSANAPLDNKASGGDFTVSLSSISTSMQKTR